MARLHKIKDAVRAARHNFAKKRLSCSPDEHVAAHAMETSLRPGLSRPNRIVVDPDRTISFMGEKGRVYRTLGRSGSFGIEVAVKHAAPTPGMTVEITATVTMVEGRKVAFEVAKAKAAKHHAR